MDQGGSNGVEKKWVRSRHVLKIELTEFPERSKVRCQREEPWMPQKLMRHHVEQAGGYMSLEFGERSPLKTQVGGHQHPKVLNSRDSVRSPRVTHQREAVLGHGRNGKKREVARREEETLLKTSTKF